MLAHVVAHEGAPGLDGEPVRFRVRKRLAHDPARDPAAFEPRRNFGVMNAHHAVDEMIVRDTQAAVHFGFEAVLGRVVAHFDGGVGGALGQDDGFVP